MGVLPAARNSNTTALLVGSARHQRNAPLAYGHDFLIILLIGNATWEQYPWPLNSNEGCLVRKSMRLSFDTWKKKAQLVSDSIMDWRIDIFTTGYLIIIIENKRLKVSFGRPTGEGLNILHKHANPSTQPHTHAHTHHNNSCSFFNQAKVSQGRLEKNVNAIHEYRFVSLYLQVTERWVFKRSLLPYK